MTLNMADCYTRSITKILYVIYFTFSFFTVVGQNKRSIHELQNDFYNRNPQECITDNIFNINRHTNRNLKTKNSKPENYIFGWHPHWKGDLYTEYNLQLMSEISYFSYEVNASTGEYNSIHNWKKTKLVEIAHTYGTKVSLTATLFGKENIELLLSNNTSITTFIKTIVGLVKLKNADGINIDFEGLRVENNNNLDSQFTDMISRLSRHLKSEIPNATLSIALPAVDWSNAFNITDLSNHVDLFVMMGYDYHWKTSKQAGPVAPLQNSDKWGNISISNSIERYINSGMQKNKFCVAFAYYGYDWPTESNILNSNTLSRSKSRTFANIKTEFANNTKNWDESSESPYFIYTKNDTVHQCWYESKISLQRKYEYSIDQNIKGIGIWALGYDIDKNNKYNDLWLLLEEVFLKEKTTETSIFDEEKTEFEAFYDCPNIKIRTNRSGIYSCSVVSTMGACVYLNPRLKIDSDEIKSINLYSVDSGIYIVRLFANGKKRTVKLFIK